MERNFSLPNIESLTKQQEKIRALPIEGRYLIVGGPGTGKSVVALLRVKKLQREKKVCICLAFNKLLITANAQLAQEEIQSRQWQSWFNELYKKTLNQKSVPMMDTSYSFKPYNWQVILKQIEIYCQSNAEKTDFSEQYLVIDEGQDMPPEFYQALIQFGFKNFFVVADQNQRITESNSSLRDLMQNLMIENHQIHDLVDNYRNSYAIAQLCEHFFTDVGSEKPQLPQPSFNSQKPILCGYEQERFLDVIKRIVNMAKDKPNHLIGVICPRNEVSNRYFSTLQRYIQQSQFQISLTRHYGETRDDVCFNKGGIVILNAQGCKGLEFDTVFLADINALYINPKDIDSTKKLLYVMTSRAKERLILLIDKMQPYNDILALLPKNQDILEKFNV